MSESVSALRSAFAELLAQTPCVGRQPPEPVAMMASACDVPGCPSCRGRSALRAYELEEARRFRVALGERARLDVAEQMAEVLAGYAALLLATSTVASATEKQGVEEMLSRVQDVLKGYQDAKALGAVAPA